MLRMFERDRLLLNKIVIKQAVSKITAFFYWLQTGYTDAITPL
jgi:hypothetical protein